MRNLKTVSHNDCINLHFHQQCKRISFSLHSCQQLLSFSILIIAILINIRWYLNFGFNFHNDYWCWTSFHILAICISFLEKCLFRSFAHFFKARLFIFFCYWVKYDVSGNKRWGINRPLLWGFILMRLGVGLV